MGFDFNNKRHVNKVEDKKIKYAPAKRHLAKWQWYLLVLIILSPLIYFVSAILIDNLVVIASGYVSYDKILVRAPENGYIKNVLAKEGEYIKLGQCLVKMDSPKLTRELKYLQKELNRLNKLRLSTKNPEVDPFIVMKNNLKKHLEKTNEHVEVMDDLRRRKIGTIIDQQRARMDAKEIELDIDNVDRAMAKSNVYHVFKLEERYGEIIRELELAIIKIKVANDLMNIPSPGNGSITKVFTHPNEHVTKGQDLVEITTYNNLRVLAYLNHKDMSNDIYQGKKVTVIFPNDIKIEGEIAQIPSLAEHQDKFTNIIKTEKNKVLLIITLIGKLPKKYQIYGLPVKVVLEDYGLSFFIN
jgi:multidrug resistance efflux pump